MLNFTRKIKLYVFILISILISCKKSFDKKIILYYNNGKLIQSDFFIYQYKNSKYICISDKKVNKITKGIVIDSMYIITPTRSYVLKPLKILDSKMPTSDFVYPVFDNNKIDIVKINKKEMFTIASNVLKTDVLK